MCVPPLFTHVCVGLIIHTTGRGRLFLTQSRSDLASAIKSASEDVSAPFTVGPGQLLSTWTETRAKLGAEAGEPMGTFPVTKPSCRHPLSPSLRSLVLTQQFLLEVDQITGTTVSSRSLSSVYAIVRVASSPNDITIEYKDGQHRTYQSASREDLACSILDATLCIGNSDVSITECVSDGYRLLPRGVREQVSPPFIPPPPPPPSLIPPMCSPRWTRRAGSWRPSSGLTPLKRGTSRTSPRRPKPASSRPTRATA